MSNLYWKYSISLNLNDFAINWQLLEKVAREAQSFPLLSVHVIFCSFFKVYSKVQNRYGYRFCTKKFLQIWYSYLFCTLHKRSREKSFLQVYSKVQKRYRYRFCTKQQHCKFCIKGHVKNWKSTISKCQILFMIIFAYVDSNLMFIKWINSPKWQFLRKSYLDSVIRFWSTYFTFSYLKRKHIFKPFYANFIKTDVFNVVE